MSATKPRKLPPRPEPIDPAGLYTYEEAAAHLRLDSVREVRDMVAEGRIGCVEVNRRQRRIQGRHLLEFMDRQARAAFR